MLKLSERHDDDAVKVVQLKQVKDYFFGTLISGCSFQFSNKRQTYYSLIGKKMIRPSPIVLPTIASLLVWNKAASGELEKIL